MLAGASRLYSARGNGYSSRPRRPVALPKPRTSAAAPDRSKDRPEVRPSLPCQPTRTRPRALSRVAGLGLGPRNFLAAARSNLQGSAGARRPRTAPVDSYPVLGVLAMRKLLGYGGVLLALALIL